MRGTGADGATVRYGWDAGIDAMTNPPPDDLTSRVASKRHDYAVKVWGEASDGGATVSVLPRSGGGGCRSGVRGRTRRQVERLRL